MQVINLSVPQHSCCYCNVLTSCAG
jgi:hypothetical protein